MSVIKSITRSSAVQGVVCWIMSLYMRLLSWTGRWQVIGQELPEQWLESGKPFIVAFWHGRLLMMFLAWRYPDRVHVLISGHRDGQLISRTIAHFGAKTVIGSQRRGGSKAALQIARHLRNGEVVAVTPDGPRGPRMRVKDGIITLATIGNAPIIPLTYACRPRKVIGSWDRFNLPLPFCRGVLMWGEPIEVPRDADAETKERLRLKLEAAIQDITDRADAMLGNPATEPEAASGLKIDSASQAGKAA
ncbi:MAG TPA: hypothetical protein DCE33_12785 [Rhodospirillaceae bacterium]|nr:hypothetical protein [Rhodospirillaceae bacterium]